MQYYSPLRYPGGKGRLAPFVKHIYEMNNLLDGHYVEPYAGGAAIALDLLFQECVSDIHINDLSRSVYSFWYSVLNYSSDLCEKIATTQVTTDEWSVQKHVQRNPDSHSLLNLGFSTFFLNRTNRSGILNGGIIGGKNQTGEWKIDARYNRDELIRRIQRIARYKNRIHLYNKDAKVLITELFPSLPQKTLIYFDPPYYAKGQDLYRNYYKHEDHIDIAQQIFGIQQNWIVSYDKVPEISDAYSGYRNQVYSLNYSAARYQKGSEIMFFCNRLQIPLMIG